MKTVRVTIRKDVAKELNAIAKRHEQTLPAYLDWLLYQHLFGHNRGGKNLLHEAYKRNAAWRKEQHAIVLRALICDVPINPPNQ